MKTNKAVVAIAAAAISAIAMVWASGCDGRGPADDSDTQEQRREESPMANISTSQPTTQTASGEAPRVPLGVIDVPEGTPQGEWLEIGGHTPLLWCYRGGKRLVFEQAGPKVYLSVDEKSFRLAGIIVRSKAEALLLDKEAEQPLAAWFYGPQLAALDMMRNADKITSLQIWEFDTASSYKYEAAIISDLSPLERLSSLSSLSIRNCANVQDIDSLKSLKGLTSLDISGCSVTSLSPLNDLTNLRALNMVFAFAPGHPYEYQEYSPLKSLRSLQSLKLDIRELTHDDYDLAELMSHLRSLTDLTIEGSVDPALVKYLSSLRSLTVVGYVKDLQPLAGLKKLAKLRISDTESPLDLAPMKGCTGLTELDLRLTYNYSDSAPTDLRPIGALRHLKVLSIETPQGIKNLSAIGTLSSLVSLKIQAANLKDLSAIAELRDLRELDLSRNRLLSDLSPLSKLASLESLRVTMCGKIDDLQPLRELKNLKSLDSSVTAVEDLVPLSDLGNLRQLRLAWCPVVDISPLAKLPKLGELSLSRCPVADLRPLSAMKALTDLDLGWPAHAETDDDGHSIPISEQVDVMMRVSPIKDVSPLASLRQLRRLNLHNCQQAENLGSLDLPALKYLHLPSHITDKDFHDLIERHQNLSELCISDNTPIPLRGRTPWKFSLQPLSGLTHLRTLSLAEMNDLSPLKHLRSLTDLSLVIRTPTSTEPLSSLTQIRKIILLSGPEQMDLSFTAHLPNLFGLNVPVTRRSDLTPLVPLLQRGVQIRGILDPSLEDELSNLWRKAPRDR